jgi:hypothetical protein
MSRPHKMIRPCYNYALGPAKAVRQGHISGKRSDLPSVEQLANRFVAHGDDSSQSLIGKCTLTAVLPGTESRLSR